MVFNSFFLRIGCVTITMGLVACPLCWAHILSNATKWSLGGTFPFGEYLRLAHVFVNVAIVFGIFPPQYWVCLPRSYKKFCKWSTGARPPLTDYFVIFVFKLATLPQRYRIRSSPIHSSKNIFLGPTVGAAKCNSLRERLLAAILLFLRYNLPHFLIP